MWEKTLFHNGSSGTGPGFAAAARFLNFCIRVGFHGKQTGTDFRVVPKRTTVSLSDG
jgi:hypothetical protein